MALAPPFVAYSSFTEALVPTADWDSVYASLQALKGHVQEYPGCQRFEVFVRAEPAGTLRLPCSTTGDPPSQLEAFLERGSTHERLLADLASVDPERSLVMEKVF
jgi:hypothetical protein